MPIVAYKVKSSKAKKEQYILIESSVGGNVPRNASVASIQKAAVALQESLEPISAVADAVFQTLRKATPGKVEIQFGIELGGKTGLPLVVSGEAKANFQVTLTWEKAEAAT